MRSLVAAALLVAAVAWAQPSRVACGPAAAACGPAAVLGVTTTTTLPGPINLPVADATDSNCPTTPLAPNSTTTSGNEISASRTCATGANAHGYDVTGIAVYIQNVPVGSHLKCSVWTYPASYNAGTTSVAKVAATCDSAEWTSTLNPNAYIPLAIAGPCHLAPATRYFLGCNGDSAGGATAPRGVVISCNNCEQLVWTQTYPLLPDPWTASFQSSNAMAYYLTLTPTP